MSFSIRIKGSAAGDLRRIANSERLQIVAAIDRLKENPYLGSALKGELRGLRRLRAGDFRVIYELRDDALVVLVVRTAHRREAYRSRG